MTRPKNFDASELRFPCVNTTDEVIPPFAIMALAPSESSGPPILKHSSSYTTLGPGPMEVRVRKPEDDDILLGNPAVFCFNTELPIPASSDSGKGECTFNLPAFAQLDPGGARERGCLLMPEADSWVLHKNHAGIYTLRTWWIDGSIDIGLVDAGGVCTVTHAMSPSGGIPAASGSQMGSASCVLYKTNATGNRSSTGTSDTVWNPSETAIAGSKYIVIEPDKTGLLIAVVESC